MIGCLSWITQCRCVKVGEGCPEVEMQSGQRPCQSTEYVGRNFGGMVVIYHHNIEMILQEFARPNGIKHKSSYRSNPCHLNFNLSLALAENPSGRSTYSSY